MSDREFQIVVLGATGFTGRLVARWLAETQPELRWAMAGRNLTKLQGVRDDVAQRTPAAASVPLIEVDVSKPDTVQAMAGRTQVVLTTAGPFTLYGPPVVQACVDQGTDYVDITGEPGFVADMVRTHHEAAAAKGLRIISCCGMDSVPFDMGAWFAVQQLPQQQAIDVRGYFKANARVSGGTWNTIVEILSRGSGSTEGLVYRGPDRRARSLPTKVHRSPHGDWGVPVPTVDPLIVMRSAQLLGYGPAFRYAHHVRLSSMARIAGLGLGFAGVAALCKLPGGSRWLGNRIPPGTGATEEQMAAGWLKADFHATEGAVATHVRLTTDIDPGYSFTARMIACAALCLVYDRDELAHAGVVTTAAAMAVPYRRRLEQAGMGFHVIESPA